VESIASVSQVEKQCRGLKGGNWVKDGRNIEQSQDFSAVHFPSAPIVFVSFLLSLTPSIVSAAPLMITANFLLSSCHLGMSNGVGAYASPMNISPCLLIHGGGHCGISDIAVWNQEHKPKLQACDVLKTIGLP